MHMAECRSQQNISLSEDELTAAMKLLDKRGSGYIEFDEFVDWWVNKVCLWALHAIHVASICFDCFEKGFTAIILSEELWGNIGASLFTCAIDGQQLRTCSMCNMTSYCSVIQAFSTSVSLKSAMIHICRIVC